MTSVTVFESPPTTIFFVLPADVSPVAFARDTRHGIYGTSAISPRQSVMSQLPLP